LSQVVGFVSVPGKAKTPADDLLVMPAEQLMDPDSPTLPVGGGQVLGDELRIGQRFQLHFLYTALRETSRLGETEQLSFSSGRPDENRP